MTQHKAPLPPGLPSKMKGLKRDSAGRPVPFFVGYVDGKPDFRTMDSKAFRRATMENLCWVCGSRLHRIQGTMVGSFVAGPMCLVNGTSAEPPSHDECAQWSARACPFLTNPEKVRREANMPENVGEAAGIAILRNPGVTAVIESMRWNAFNPGNGVLFKFDRIRRVDFLARGEPATTKEIMESIETGLPALHNLAVEDGADAIWELSRLTRLMLGWVPDGDVALNTGDYPLTAGLVAG